MPNSTLYKKIKPRLYLLSTTPNDLTKDGSYSIYDLEGEDQLGKPYSYTLTFVSPTPIKVEEMTDTDVKILLSDEKDPSDKREIYAKVYKAKESQSVGDKYLYTLTCVHPLYYLGLNRRYEIYQDKSAHEIIQEILKRYKALLHINYKTNIAPHLFIKREYTNQYKQSDLEFIQMLCEQEGVTLRMQSSSNSPYTITLTHINETYSKLSDELRCSYTLSKRFSVSHTTEDYYDFRRPSFEFLSSTGAKALSQSKKDNKHSSQLRHDLEYMTHADRLEVPREKDIKNNIKQSSLKNYSDSERIEGESISIHTITGYGGVLFDHKAKQRTEAIFTKTTIKGFFPNALDEYIEDRDILQSYTFKVKFEATPKDTVYIPPYNIEKPLIPSSVTAIVSKGSKDTESTPNTIDVDEFGRIRVVFHFDPKYPTSCYIRFANFWSGDGWGAQFIPRVNTEVIVNFLNGDPDRPVVIGSLYNGNNKIPENLPDNKTKSYIKTRSIPGGDDNFNLLLFEDKKGKELVHMQAEKDHLLHVKHDSDNNIDHDERTNIGHDRTENVGHDEKITIGNDRTEEVKHNEKITIGKNRKESVGKNEHIKIGKNQHEKVGMFKTETIGIAKALTIGAGYQVSVGATKNETIGMSSSEQVGVKKSTVVGKRYEIKVGKSSIVLNSDGTILIKGVKILMEGSDHVEVNGEIVDIN